MSLFSFSRKSKKTDLPAPSKVEIDTMVNLLPGKLNVSIQTHEVSWQEKQLPCLSYVTDGLAAVGQKELVLTLENQGGLEQPYPAIPLEFFKMVYKAASEGSFVEEGGRTVFRQPFLGKMAIIYMKRPDEISGLYTPEEYLNMILLTEKEMDAVNRYGYQRILSMLGNVYRHYPCPFWNDLSRKELSLTSLYKKSFLNQAYGFILSESTVTQVDNEVILKITKGAVGVDKVPAANAPIAILPSLDLSAEGCFTWDSTQLSIISPYTDVAQLKRIGGCFLLLIANQDTPLVKVIEDGFALLMTNQQWQQFWKAVFAEQTFDLKMPGNELSFSLEWVAQVNQREEIPISDFHNPIDHNVYSGQWKTVQPDTVAETTGKVQVENLRVISNQATVSGNVDGETLGVYARKIGDAVSGLPCNENGGHFVIQVTLSQSSPPLIELAFENTVSQDYVQDVYKTVNAIGGINTKKNDVVFQINMLITQ